MVCDPPDMSWRPLANYAVKGGVVCLQVKLRDPHLSALEVKFSRRGAIQIYVYLYLHPYMALSSYDPSVFTRIG